MRVQKRLGVLVAKLNCVVEVDLHTANSKMVVGQSLLERRRHEIITRSAAIEDGEMDLEPEEVEEERHNNQTDCASNKVLGKLLHGQSIAVVEQVPEINRNSSSDSHKGKDTDVFSGDGARKRKTGKEEPLPPFTRERSFAELGESDVTEEGAGHGKDQGGIEEDQASLADVGIV